MARPDLKGWGWRVVPLVLIVAVWQLLSGTKFIDPAFLPPPSAVLAAFADLLSGGEIAQNLLITLFRSAVGLVLGAISGVWIGLMMARSPIFRAYVAPIVGGTYSLPKSALIPLFALWFGIGNVTAICAVYLACLLPMIVNTYHGVVTTPKVLTWSAEALGTGRKQMLTRIYLRHALPDIFTGLRIALGFSFVLAISAEMIASSSGIGKLMFMYGENGTYDYMFGALACIIIVAFLADRAMLAVSAWCLRWHESAARAETA
ncbi:MAG TPA: ABC transporter permease [Pseudolabrys sp.]|nr:ABC transporter permease [Pseudolabrys sp.]